MQRHRAFLKAALRECRQSEEKRAVRFERAQSASDRAQLEKRFEMEREMDQQRLQRLTTDFDLIKKAIERGEISSSMVEQRKQFSKKPVLPKLDVEHNRFSGCETYADIIKHESAIKMFDKIDRAAHAKLRPKFDPYPVQKNLQLLQQKREILTQLIDVQAKEIRARQGSGGGGPAATLSLSLSRPNRQQHQQTSRWETGSTASGASSATSASWASFASARHNVPAPARRLNVPRLKL